MPVSAPKQSTLSDCQAKALDVLMRQGNVFLTGAAGTGKSYLLDYYLKDKSTGDFPVVASTGAAAVIVGGRTFHSFFGLGILEGGPDTTVARALRSRKLTNRLNRASCVVIDEVSMLSGTVLRVAETISRRARGRDEPWGGLRIIAVGDFAQLPPVTPNEQDKDWAFRHAVWHESDFQPALLSTVMRTQDTSFLKILNFVRKGLLNEEVHEFLDRHTRLEENPDATRLYPHRAQADEYNLKRLDAIPRPLYSFQTQYEGKERYLEAAKKAIPIPDTLLLKEGALIMMRKNDVSGSLRFVNGSLGNIRRIADGVLKIRLLTGCEINVGKDKFSYLDGDGNEAMAAWNFPVTLAWASTIHKAQGASLDRTIVNLSSLWETGQAYVALSRVRSSQGLTIERWTPSSIRAEPLVTDFYDQLAEKAERYEPRPLFVPAEHSKAGAPDGRRAFTSDERVEMARMLLRDREDLDLIAGACGVKIATVLKYIEKLISLGVVPDISYLIEGMPHADRIRDLYREHGIERMKPVFDALDGTVSYDDLRLIRLVLMAERK